MVAGAVVSSPGQDPVRELAYPCARREKRVDSVGKDRHNLLAWLIKFCSRAPQEPQTRSRPDWLVGLHGTIPSRMGAVLPSLLPCSIQTPTRQRLILTRCPVNLDLFRYFDGGRLSHRLRINLSILCGRAKTRTTTSRQTLSRLFTVQNRTAVRFFFFRNHTVRFGAVLIFENRTVWCGAVRFSPFQNHTVRCSTVLFLNGAVRCG